MRTIFSSARSCRLLRLDFMNIFFYASNLCSIDLCTDWNSFSPRPTSTTSFMRSGRTGIVVSWVPNHRRKPRAGEKLLAKEAAQQMKLVTPC